MVVCLCEDQHGLQGSSILKPFLAKIVPAVLALSNFGTRPL